MTRFRTFTCRTSVYRLSEREADSGCAEIERQRTLLETYIARHPRFRDALEPIGIPSGPDVPRIAVEMARAAAACGVGPMAAVAGAVADAAAEAMRAAGAEYAIVDNGGDLSLSAQETVVVALYAGSRESARDSGANRLALRFAPDVLPCGVCSSSASMGHSRSFGAADLATVVAESAVLADAAATRLCNDVASIDDAPGALEAIVSIPGVRGAVVVVDCRIALIGGGIDLIRHDDVGAALKVSAHRDSDYRGAEGAAW